jgi:hypothetical protein
MREQIYRTEKLMLQNGAVCSVRESELDEDVVAANGNKKGREKPRYNLAKTATFCEFHNVLSFIEGLSELRIQKTPRMNRGYTTSTMFEFHEGDETVGGGVWHVACAGNI